MAHSVTDELTCLVHN